MSPTKVPDTIVEWWVSKDPAIGELIGDLDNGGQDSGCSSVKKWETFCDEFGIEYRKIESPGPASLLSGNVALRIEHPTVYELLGKMGDKRLVLLRLMPPDWRLKYE